MIVGEGEGRIAGHGDPLPERRDRWRVTPFRLWYRRCQPRQLRDVDMTLDNPGSCLQKFLQTRGLLRLDQSEMALRQDHIVSPRDQAQHRHPERPAGFPQRLRMQRAADAIEDDARDMHVGPMVCKAADERPGRGRLRAYVNDENDREPESCREIRRRACFAFSPVKQTHNTLTDDEIGIPGGGSQRGTQRRRAHAPRIEVPARPPRRNSVERGIYIVGTNLERAHSETRVRQMTQQCQGDHGFAAT